MSLSKKLSIQDVDLKNKRVLIRVDYNVPLNKNFEVEDPRRITSTVPTIQYALEKGAKSIVLISHLGRPNGLKNPKHSLQHILPSLKKALSADVTFVPSFDSDAFADASSHSPSKRIYLLENLRFHLEEEGKGLSEEGEKIAAAPNATAAFRRKLSQLGDVFVFDAFAAAHRAHSSVVGVDLAVRAAGFLMRKELTFFSKALESPERPFLSILGGAKVSDKIQLIESLLDKVDEMIIGGGMAYTFLKVTRGMEIGDSLFDGEGAKIVPRIMEKADAKNVAIHLPIDFVVADEFDSEAKTTTRTSEEGIPPHWMGLDCGEKSCEKFAEIVKRAKTIVWNGPLGVFEFPRFANGTNSLLRSVAEATESGRATSIIGGGDTASAAEKLGVSASMSHVSTGGGASLELLEGKVLPGIQHLSKK